MNARTKPLLIAAAKLAALIVAFIVIWRVVGAPGFDLPGQVQFETVNWGIIITFVVRNGLYIVWAVYAWKVAGDWKAIAKEEWDTYRLSKRLGVDQHELKSVQATMDQMQTDFAQLGQIRDHLVEQNEIAEELAQNREVEQELRSKLTNPRRQRAQ